MEEIGRLLHNYLASAMSLVDHARRHTKKLYCNDRFFKFFEECDQEIDKRFDNSANHQLAQGLRNYTQHRTLPVVVSVISWSRDEGLNRTFKVASESLLEWKKWKPLARKKLRQLKDGLPIRQFAEEYYAEVESFYQWLWTKQAEIHKQDIDRLNEIKRRARLAFEEAGLGDIINQDQP